MLVLKLEMHSAITGQVKEIGRVLIGNDGTSETRDRGSYDVKVLRRASVGRPMRDVLAAATNEEPHALADDVMVVVRAALDRAASRQPTPTGDRTTEAEDGE